MSCNNNTNSTRIIVSHGCNPCNPCVTCSRCSCDCVCDTPNYSTAGCITMQGSDCVQYTGPAITSPAIPTNTNLTDIIQLLAGVTPTPATLAVPMQAIDSEELKSVKKSLESKITSLSTKVKKGGLINEITVSTDDVINVDKDANQMTISIDFDAFLDKFIESIKSNSVNASKLAQVIEYSKNTNDFVPYPNNVDVQTKGTGIAVTWSAVTGADSYTVYHKKEGSISAVNAGNTPGTGITILGLEPQTSYKVFVIANSFAGNQSAPSPTFTVKTN